MTLANLFWRGVSLALRVFWVLLILLGVWRIYLGYWTWTGQYPAGAFPPIPFTVAKVLAAYPCWREDGPRSYELMYIRLTDIQVDLSHVQPPAADAPWKYAPVKDTSDKLYVAFRPTEAPPPGPTTVIGYQLWQSPGPLPAELVAQSQRAALFVVTYETPRYIQDQHDGARTHFRFGAVVLLIAAVAPVLIRTTKPWWPKLSVRAAALMGHVARPASPVELAAAQAWHTRLLETLRDCGVERAPTSAGLTWLVSAAMVLGVAIVTLVGGRLVDANLRNTPDVELRWGINVVWLTFVIFVLARVRNRFLRTAWQASARNAERELQRGGLRRPILYLRSFQLDDQISRPSWLERVLGIIPLQNAEQKLTSLLRKIGPVIAIGRPDEKLPALGAARFYVAHDRWKLKVEEIARESRYVVWATGATEGLSWEISHLIENIPPMNVILLAHPHLLSITPAEREQEWGRFRAALGKLFPKPLPEKLGAARLIYFTSDWEPRPVAPPRRVWTWFGTDGPALRAVLKAKQGKLSEAAVVYSGLREDDDVAGLIGASQQPIAWLRGVAFLIALVAMQLPNLWQESPRFWIIGLPNVVLLAAAAVAAFRYLPSVYAPAVAALAPVVYGRFIPGASGSIESYVASLALLAGLSWATRRIRPLAAALWMGSMCGLLARTFMSDSDFMQLSPDEMEALRISLLGPVFFTVAFLIALRFLPQTRENVPPPGPDHESA